jgi:hypothetical protein
MVAGIDIVSTERRACADRIGLPPWLLLDLSNR